MEKFVTKALAKKALVAKGYSHKDRMGENDGCGPVRREYYSKPGSPINVYKMPYWNATISKFGKMWYLSEFGKDLSKEECENLNKVKETVILSNGKTKLNFVSPTDLVVCDPCYIFNHRVPKLDKVWQQLCAEWYSGDKPAANAAAGTVEYDGTVCLYTNTAHGDGTYAIDHCPGGRVINNEIPVDAGMVCVMTRADVYRLNPNFRFEDYAQVHGFVGEVIATGTTLTGDLVVETEDSQDEDWE